MQAAKGPGVICRRGFRAATKRVWIWFLPQGKEVSINPGIFFEGIRECKEAGTGIRNRPMGS